MLELSFVGLHDALNDGQGLLELCLALATIMCHYFALVMGWCDQLKLQLPRLIIHFMLCCEQCLLDSFNTIIASACQTEVDADFKRMYC